MPSKPFKVKFNAAAHQRYMAAVEADQLTPAKITSTGMMRLVKGVWVTQAEFAKNNPIPTVHSFLMKVSQVDGRKKYLTE